MKKLGLAITSLFVSAIASAPAIVAQIKPEKTNSAARDDQRISRAGVFDRYGHLPLSFEPNEGQSSSEVKFLAHGLGYGLFLTQDGAVLSLRDTRPDGANGKALFGGPVLPEAKELLRNTDAQAAMSASVLRMQVVGANPAASVVGSEELSGKSNYFIGNQQKKWRTNLSTYARVKYREIYPGVDLIYYGNQGRLEYDFVVAPGADPKRIRLAISRAAEEEAKESASKVQRSLRIDKNGDLVVATRVGQVRYQKPVAYQVGPHGGKRVIPARFEFKSKGEVAFALGAYDHAKDLVIDPTLVYSTYVAGATPGPYYFGYTGDQAAAIAVDSNGSAYITGLTASGDFPITPGAQQTVCKPYNNGCAGAPGQGFGTAVFVTKLSPDGSSLVYATYIAGSSVGGDGNTDSGSGIAMDPSGNAYIAGTTNSPDFPVTQGAYQTVCGPRLDMINPYYCYGSHIISTCGPQGQGTKDGFVTKLNSTGSGLVYSTFVGGSHDDVLTGIAVNSAGEAYVSGWTLSSYSYSPGGGGCGCPGGPGTCDPNINQTADYGYPITPNGYFPGALPAPPSEYQPWPFGSPSAFTSSSNSVLSYPFRNIAAPVFSKLSADGSTMLYSTYIGGGFGPAFPTSPALGDGQTFYPYLQQFASGIAVDSFGNAYLTGESNASDQCCTQFHNYQFSGFPTTPGAVQPHNASDCVNGNCAYDAFVAKFDPTQSGAASLVYSTNLGGRGDDNANAIAVDSGGNAYVVGTATRTGYGSPPTFPTTPGTLQPNCPGNCMNSYGWVARLNSTATNLDYSTYLSGTGYNSANAIAIDSGGNACVAGQTNSRDFPTQNPLQGYAGGALTSAFVSVLDPAAQTLLFSTYLGSDNQGVYANNGVAGIALDSSNNIYVTGSTTSSRFPTTPGAFQTTCSKCSTGSWGVFVDEISAPVPSVAPAITSASSTTFQVGVAGSFTVTATGTPTPSLSESGALPPGVTFTDNGDGTGTLSGTPTDSGTFSITFTAHNGASPDATQSFTLTDGALQSIAGPRT